MNSSGTRWVLIIAVVVLAGLGVYWLLNRDAGGQVESIPDDAETGDAADCPLATPEFFTVEPVTSPTDQLTQIITVDLGNGEAITITTESGTFTAPFDTFPKEIEITLLLDTVHNLTVEGKVAEVRQGDCVYGGYVLSTTTDRNGEPLVIEQRP